MNGKYSLTLIALVAVVWVSAGALAIPLDDAPTVAPIADEPHGGYVSAVDGAETRNGADDGDDRGGSDADGAAIHIERTDGHTSVEGDSFDYENDDGSVEFVTDDGLEIETDHDGEVEIEGPGYEIEQRGDDLEVTGDGIDYRDDGGSADVETGGWEIEQGDGHASVESGTIDYENDDGSVEVETGDGVEVEIDRDGDVDIEGPGYEIEQRGGDLDVERDALGPP